MAVNFSYNPTTVHPRDAILQQQQREEAEAGPTQTSSNSSLHVKRVGDIDAMIVQELELGQKENSVYFLISMSWWNKWRNFQGMSPEVHFETRIDNWPLIRSEEREEEAVYTYDR